MSFTMALASNINYSLDVNATFLANVFLLAMAVHPTAPKLLYALYGNTNNTSTSNYSSYHLLTWRALDTSSTHTLVDNITLVNNIDCLPSCEMEASDFLLLIQNRFKAFIFQIKNVSKALVSNNASRTFLKTREVFGLHALFRQYTVLEDYSIFFNGSYLEVTQYNITNIAMNPVFVLQSWNIPTNLTYLGTQLRVTANTQYIIWAANQTNVQVSYICFSCFLANTSTLPTTISTGMSSLVSLHLAISFGRVGSQVFWVNADTLADRYELISDTTFTLLESIGSPIEMAAANGHLVVFYENTHYITRDIGNNAVSFLSNFSLSTPLFVDIVINSNSELASVYNFNDSQTITQYQVVTSCSIYQATEVNNTCLCNNFTSLYCALATTTEQNESSLPKAVLIGIVLGGIITGVVVVATLVYIIFKKCFSKVSKRIPYKYNSFELMSFEA